MRLRKLVDNSNEYVVPCHNDHISALRFSESGQYLATVCENGMYIRVWGWYESASGEMEPPVSLYMFEIMPNNGAGLVSDIRMTRDLNCFVATIIVQCKSSNSNSASSNQQLDLPGFPANNSGGNVDQKVTQVKMFKFDHRKHENEGIQRN